MKREKRNLYALMMVLFVFFSISKFAAFYWEDNYTMLMKSLYEKLSFQSINFISTGFNIHIPSSLFVFSFVTFTLLFIFLLYFMTIKQRMLNILITSIVLIISTLVYVYFDAIKIVHSDLSNLSGKVELQQYDINYDLILVTTLIISLLPALITVLLKYSGKEYKDVLPHILKNKSAQSG